MKTVKELLQDGWSIEKEREGQGMMVLQGYDARSKLFLGEVYMLGGPRFPIEARTLEIFIATAEAILTLKS